jgi:hypothetical protein
MAASFDMVCADRVAQSLPYRTNGAPWLDDMRKDMLSIA